MKMLTVFYCMQERRRVKKKWGVKPPSLLPLSSYSLLFPPLSLPPPLPFPFLPSLPPSPPLPFPPFPFPLIPPSLTSPPLPLEVGPLNPARVSGERCKLHQRVPGWSPVRGGYAQYTPPTPMRRNCRVESRRRCVLAFMPLLNQWRS